MGNIKSVFHNNSRTFNFADFDMPWAVTKAGFKYHSAISQFNQGSFSNFQLPSEHLSPVYLVNKTYLSENRKAFFYYGRVAITFAIGLPLYGTIPAFTGTRNSEDLLFWKCDTSHPGCDIICYNRFLPIMPGRLLQFQVISNVPTHHSLMRHELCHIHNFDSNYQ